MIDEDDIDLFRNTVESQKPFDKDLKNLSVQNYLKFILIMVLSMRLLIVDLIC